MTPLGREVVPDVYIRRTRSASRVTWQGGTVSAEVYDPAKKTFWYTYGWPDGDMRNFDKKIYGFNENAWGAGAWIPFILDQLTEEGWYTDWEGRITPMGSRYVAKLIKDCPASKAK